MLRRAGLLMGLFLIASPVLAADPPRLATMRPMPAVTTEAFVQRTASGNSFEIESSKLAVAKTSSSAVRAFAEQMIEDHAEAGDSFRTVLSQIGMKLPSDELDAPRRMIIDNLKSKQAADFDKEYVQAQYNTHAETVLMFQAYAVGGDNDRLRKFATDLLPQMQAHLDNVKKLRK
jgi:putative membrane protein